MKILAFLQNPAFPEGTSQETVTKYNNDIAYRRTVLRRYMTGQRILLALGEELFETIDFDNVILQNGTIRVKTAPDMDHVTGTIEALKPDLILTFGSVARFAIEQVDPESWTGVHLACRHPNARGMTKGELAQFGMTVKASIKRLEKKNAISR